MVKTTAKAAKHSNMVISQLYGHVYCSFRVGHILFHRQFHDTIIFRHFHGVIIPNEMGRGQSQLFCNQKSAVRTNHRIKLLQI